MVEEAELGYFTNPEWGVHLKQIRFLPPKNFPKAYLTGWGQTYSKAFGRLALNPRHFRYSRKHSTRCAAIRASFPSREDGSESFMKVGDPSRELRSPFQWLRWAEQGIWGNVALIGFLLLGCAPPSEPSPTPSDDPGLWDSRLQNRQGIRG